MRNILVNLCHGNEPYILGTGIAQGVVERLQGNDDSRIIVPNLYGKRQERIMQEEGLLGEKVVLDKDLGEIYKPIIFADANFGINVKNILEKRKTTEQAVRDLIQERYGRVFLEVNVGAHFTSGEDIPVFLAYPSIYSELYQRTLEEPELIRHFNKSDLERLTTEMLKLDEEINTFFVPSHHMLSYDSSRKPFDREVSTPPLKKIPPVNKDVIPEDSVYVMLSGTGSEMENSLNIARELNDKGHHVFVPFWTPQELGREYERKSPEIISNPNLTKVVGRPGWGIIWTCQNAGTNFQALPYTPGDEPEIFFNVKTLESVPLLEETERQKQKFGTLDGISFVVDDIVKKIN
ncbi:MAG: hypothetical protein ABIH49_03315 [archaeon]